MEPTDAQLVEAGEVAVSLVRAYRQGDPAAARYLLAGSGVDVTGVAMFLVGAVDGFGGHLHGDTWPEVLAAWDPAVE